MGRCDDGSDLSIASPSIAQEAVCKGIVRMNSIEPINIQVELKYSSAPPTFTFSGTWFVPLLLLKLSVRHMALLNIRFIVAD